MNRIAIVSIIIFIFVILFSNSDNIIKSLIIDDKTFIKTSALTIAKNFIKIKGIDDLKKNGTSLNINSLIDECVEKLFNNILEKNNTVKAINTYVSGPDVWALIGYDNFVDNLGTLDPNIEVSSTLNNEINNMKIGVINNYDKMYNQNNSSFPNIIGPFDKKTNQEILAGLKKITTEYINKDIQDFINNYDSDLLIPKLDQIIDNYISSDPNYKDNFIKFSEDKLKPYIISELPNIITSAYNKKKEDIKIYLSTNEGVINIKKILCKELGGLYVGNSCSFKSKDDCDNFYKWPSNNIFTTFNNNTCFTSAHSGLRNLVEKNATNNDITYDSEYEKINITSKYCTNKGLEKTSDLDGNVDCKLTKNKPMLESILGTPLLDTINKKYNKNDYEQCDTNEIDGADTIPDNLKKMVNPLIKKYGSIEKSLCFDKTYGCSSDKELVNGVCYNKCPYGYITNPNNQSECYKLYASFENNGELKNKDFVTKKTINNPYLPKDVCPPGYNYNPTEKKCIEKCPDDYDYITNSNCKKKYPTKWDGKKNDDHIVKNAIWSQSKVRELKCLNPNKPELVDGLCYAKCPTGYVRVPGAPYTCRPEPCPEGYSKTDVNTCFKDTSTLNRDKICPIGYTNVAGGLFCYKDGCPTDYRQDAYTCHRDVHTYTKKGIACPPGYSKTANTCYKDQCPDGYGSSGFATCYRGPHTYDRAKICPAGYTNVAGGLFCYKDGCDPGFSQLQYTCYRPTIQSAAKGCCYTVFNKDCDVRKCPSGWQGQRGFGTTGCHCQLNVHSYDRDKVGVSWGGCPAGYRTDLTTCHGDASTHNRETLDGLEACAPGYTDFGLTCTRGAHTYDRDKVGVSWGGCPAGYRTDLTTCQLDAHTIPNLNIGAGDAASLVCPNDTKEASPGGICYPNNPPEGYQRHSISLEQWTEKCPDGWTDTGWLCTRPTKSVDKKDVTCPADYNDIGNNKCKKECEPGYEFKNEKCVQKCPNDTVNNTDTTCGREKTIKNTEDFEIPYKYRIKKRKNDYFKKII
jgi:hypothetical protein